MAQDYEGGHFGLAKLRNLGRLRVVFADSIYFRCSLPERVSENFVWILQTVRGSRMHVQSQLERLLIHPPCKVLWTRAGMAWLKTVELSAYERLVRATAHTLSMVEREAAHVKI